MYPLYAKVPIEMSIAQQVFSLCPDPWWLSPGPSHHLHTKSPNPSPVRWGDCEGHPQRLSRKSTESSSVICGRKGRFGSASLQTTFGHLGQCQSTERRQAMPGVTSQAKPYSSGPPQGSGEHGVTCTPWESKGAGGLPCSFCQPQPLSPDSLISEKVEFFESCPVSEIEACLVCRNEVATRWLCSQVPK